MNKLARLRNKKRVAGSTPCEHDARTQKLREDVSLLIPDDIEVSFDVLSCKTHPSYGVYFRRVLLRKIEWMGLDVTASFASQLEWVIDTRYKDYVWGMENLFSKVPDRAIFGLKAAMTAHVPPTLRTAIYSVTLASLHVDRDSIAIEIFANGVKGRFLTPFTTNPQTLAMLAMMEIESRRSEVDMTDVLDILEEM